MEDKTFEPFLPTIEDTSEEYRPQLDLTSMFDLEPKEIEKDFTTPRTRNYPRKSQEESSRESTRNYPRKSQEESSRESSRERQGPQEDIKKEFSKKKNVKKPYSISR